MNDTPILCTVVLERESRAVTMITNVQDPLSMRLLYDALQVALKSVVDGMLAATDKQVEAKTP